MADKTPKITSLKPVVMSDNRRVTMQMVVEDLPTVFSNVAFMMPDLSDNPPKKPPKPDPNEPSPYPNVELSILNRRRQEVTALYIVEHKEKNTSLTLHLRKPDVDEQYIARAEMTYQNETIDVVEVPFRLNQTNG